MAEPPMEDLLQAMRVARLINSLTTLFGAAGARPVEACAAMHAMILAAKEQPGLVEEGEALGAKVYAMGTEPTQGAVQP